MVADYCPRCTPSNCFQEECAVPGCDTCGTDLDPDTVVTCWACNTDTCPDCIDAHGWPCSHFREE